MFSYRKLTILILFWALLSSCSGVNDPHLVVSGEAITISQQMLPRDRLCTGTFFPHYLDHITTNSYEPIDMYDSNGTGVAINDLDLDGDLDLVFADLAGENQIFWNDGNFRFRSQAFPQGSSRAVATVDVDADGALDVVFTSRFGSLVFWRNIADGTDFPFEQISYIEVREPAYAMNWADLDLDGDLDIVTGSYDTELEKELRDSFMMGDGAGVFVYENRAGNYELQERLAEASQALAIALMDLNGDDRPDILIGNDFDSVRDFYWISTDDGWEPTDPFSATTQNTMSFDIGDVNNDGLQELFAADMHPYKFDEETNAAWMPVMESMPHHPAPDNPQLMENVLQTIGTDGQFTNVAPESGVAFSGWSWSSRFGDLDQDGFLDLYIVNGMITADTFAHMPNFELIEENQVFRNDGTGNFRPMPKWGLAATEGGRGMTMGDLDGDGDLDVVINNLLSRAIVFENRLCQGETLLVDLRDLRPETMNPYAIGAQVRLETTAGTQIRDVQAVAGYLSGVPTQLHFGVPAGNENMTLTVEWPDGRETVLIGVNPNYQIEISR